eukprot:1385228-Prymnesium_polylepis.1
MAALVQHPKRKQHRIQKPKVGVGAEVVARNPMHLGCALSYIDAVESALGSSGNGSVDARPKKRLEGAIGLIMSPVASKFLQVRTPQPQDAVEQIHDKFAIVLCVVNEAHDRLRSAHK